MPASRLVAIPIAIGLLVVGARADLVGLTAIERDFADEPGWLAQWRVIDVRATFDDADDVLLSVGAPSGGGLLATTDPAGFRNAAFGTDGPPPEELLEPFPNLAWDTFVTIGVASWSGPASPILLTPDLPAIAGLEVAIPEGEGWAALDPGLGRAGEHPGFAVTIARLVARRTSGLEVAVRLAWLDAGATLTHADAIWSLPGGADCDHDLVDDLVAIDAGLVADCDFDAIPDACAIAEDAVPDCNGNGVPDSCDLSRGTSLDADGDGIPDECVDPACPRDLDGDGQVGFDDLLIVLGAWGPCGSATCVGDLDDDGLVNFVDLLLILASWGACD